jgi:hypothetical protein
MGCTAIFLPTTLKPSRNHRHAQSYPNILRSSNRYFIIAKSNESRSLLISIAILTSLHSTTSVPPSTRSCLPTSFTPISRSIGTALYTPLATSSSWTRRPTRFHSYTRPPTGTIYTGSNKTGLANQYCWKKSSPMIVTSRDIQTTGLCFNS